MFGFSIYIPIVSTLGVVVLILAAEGFRRASAGVSACRDVWRDPRGTWPSRTAQLSGCAEQVFDSTQTIGELSEVGPGGVLLR